MEGAQDNSLLLKAIAYSALPIHVGFERLFWMSPLPPRDHLIYRSKKGWLFRIKKRWLAARNWVKDKAILKLGGHCWLLIMLVAKVSATGGLVMGICGGRRQHGNEGTPPKCSGIFILKNKLLIMQCQFNPDNPYPFQQQSVAKLWFHVVGVKVSNQTKWMYIKEWDNIAVYILKICPWFWDNEIHLVQQGACVGVAKEAAICCVWKYIEVGMRGYTLHLKILWGGVVAKEPQYVASGNVDEGASVV